MGAKKDHASRSVWALAARQHDLVTRQQLLALGFTDKAIKHRVARGRLHPVHRAVYAVGRRRLTRYGEWMAAVLSCGPGAVLSHESAAALWEIRRDFARMIEVSVPSDSRRRTPGVRVHRRPALPASDVMTREGIPVTTPACTIVDLTPRLPRNHVEAMIKEADKRDLIDPDALRAVLDDMPPQRPGVATLRELLDRATLVLPDWDLERRFLPIAERAGLPALRTNCIVNGFEVDFYSPGLGLVIETDGLRYHRTAQQQAKDIRRDQVHTVAELTPLRFTHEQIAYEPAYVEETLRAVARRLRAAA